ncbi:GNAT family acetyltransferase [Actinorhabdospora filicis]|uniref:GNAT family acetyltransferase n=1 Tax=Actinorhabdospora filicis TaxID=1785913 RepID=A0A9W6SMI5_9ACTN|nr:GNAT family N-acetyltransferase [Actinorhabdospora filicis]GLZ78642.1 GNAT family acetyltransferase [Actinorhabdospora filicis]
MTTYDELDGPAHAHTARLCLRRPAPGDHTAMHEIHADPRTNEHNPGGPAGDPHETRAWLDGWIAEWDEHGLGYWSVRETCEGEVIGLTGVRRADIGGLASYNLAYRFRPETWGRGYAQEAADAAVTAAARADPARRVAAVLRPSNAPSRKIALRAGLSYAGMVDHHGEPAELYVGG